MNSPAQPAAQPPARCSARGCTEAPLWDLRWNNPRIHTPQRRKHWVACDDHRETLGAFLSARGFLRETEPWDPIASRDDGPDQG